MDSSNVESLTCLTMSVGEILIPSFLTSSSIFKKACPTCSFEADVTIQQ